MNWDIVEGKWKQLTGAAQANWGKLSDVDQIAGNRDALIGKLQEHYGYARDEAEKEIDDWAENAKARI